MSVFAKSSGSKKSNDILSTTSPMPNWQKGGNDDAKIKADLDALIEESGHMKKAQAGGAKKSKSKKSKSSKKNKKSKNTAGAKKKNTKGKKQKGGSSARSRSLNRSLPAALLQYQATVKKAQAEVEKAGITLKGVTLINSYVGEYNKLAKAQGESNTEAFIMKKVMEDVKDVSKLKAKFADLEKKAAAKKAAKKAAKAAAKANVETTSESETSD